MVLEERVSYPKTSGLVVGVTQHIGSMSTTTKAPYLCAAWSKLTAMCRIGLRSTFHDRSLKKNQIA
jgi:hypothetical protein